MSLKNYKRHSVEVRKNNSIYFNKPERIEREYYGLNGTKKWTKCFSIDILPYNLMIYETEPLQIKNKQNKIRKNNNKKENIENYEIFEFVTSQDSIFFDKNIDHRKELEWRESLIIGDDIDFWSDAEGKWINARIEEFRNDIIDRVFKLVRRKSLDLLGFVHFQSKNIAKSGTHTEILSKEDLKEELKIEKKQIQKNKNLNVMRDNQINKKLKKMKTYYSDFLKEYNGFIKDILPLYFQLKFTEPFTREELHEFIQNVHNKESIGQILKNGSLSFLSLIKINSPGGYKGNNYDGMIFKDSNKFISENITLGYNYDGFYNIQIKADENFNLSDLIKNDVKLFIGEVSINGIFNQEKNIIEFPDFVENNPLLQLSNQKYYISCKDFYENIPVKCYYTAIRLNTFYKILLLKNYFSVNRIVKSGKKITIFSNNLKTFEIEDENICLK